ncbi:MAG: S-layer homology domain-containing protein [Oscillospiraceae bacterium]|nr:S-layer homology domain-containing protein [Oscillospiraceae bacterium]
MKLRLKISVLPVLVMLLSLLGVTAYAEPLGELYVAVEAVEGEASVVISSDGLDDAGLYYRAAGPEAAAPAGGADALVLLVGDAWQAYAPEQEISIRSGYTVLAVSVKEEAGITRIDRIATQRNSKGEPYTGGLTFAQNEYGEPLLTIISTPAGGNVYYRYLEDSSPEIAAIEADGNVLVLDDAVPYDAEAVNALPADAARAEAFAVSRTTGKLVAWGVSPEAEEPDGADGETPEAPERETLAETDDPPASRPENVISWDFSYAGGMDESPPASDPPAELVRSENGVSASVRRDADGNLTEARVTLSAEAVGTGAFPEAPIALPVEVSATSDAKDAVPIMLALPETGGAAARIEIPVANARSGTVVILIREDGSEELVKQCALTENGVLLAVAGDVTVKIVDNTKAFDDVPEDSWAADSICFAAARGLLDDTGDGTFSPESAVSRAEAAQLLFDIEGAEGYDDALQWAEAAGVMRGGGADGATREQLVVMLYRYAQMKGYDVTGSAMLDGFGDAADVSAWAAGAMRWAVGAGLIRGTDEGLEPQGTATRAQAAAIMTRFIQHTL